MNRAEDNLNFYKSYFNGVSDIIECKSVERVLLGCGKILSGFTIFIPIIFAVGIFICQKDLEKLKSLNNRVSNALSSENETEVTQNDLIDFLAMKVLDSNNNHFVVGFEKLKLESQRRFFALVANEGKLIEALDWVPKSIFEIGIGIGKAPPETIDKAIKKLCDFPNLAKITFDLSQTTYYTQSVKELIFDSLGILEEKKKGMISHSPLSLKNKNVTGVGFAEENDAARVVQVMQGIVNDLVNHPSLGSIDFEFIRPLGEYRRFAIINPLKEEKARNKGVSYDPLNTAEYLNPEDKWTAWFDMRLR